MGHLGLSWETFNFTFTIVKIGNMDVVSMDVKWAIQCVISPLCEVSKISFPVEGDVAVMKSG